MPPTLHTRSQLSEDMILRQQATTPSITYYGPNSIAAALTEGVAASAIVLEAHVEEAYRRTFLKASYGTFLTENAEKAGVPVADPERAGVYVVIVPEVSVISTITGVGPWTITFTGYGGWQVGDGVRFISPNASNAVVVASVISSTQITVNTLPGVATFTSDLATHTVRMLFRATVPIDTNVTFSNGAVFGVLDALTTGDLNPLLAGEGTTLSLVDKVWCESSTSGASSNVARMTATGLSPTIRGVNRVFNPLPASGGKDVPSDQQIKYLVAHAGNATAQSTARGLESLSRQGNRRVARAFLATSNSGINVVGVKAVPVNAASPLSSTEKSDLALFLEAYSIPGQAYDVGDVAMTSVEVYAQVSLVSGPTGETAEARRVRLRSAWNRVLSAFAEYIDATKWTLGASVLRSRLLELTLADKEITAVDTVTFLPASDVTVGSEELPYISTFSLVDRSTGYTWGDDVDQVYAP